MKYETIRFRACACGSSAVLRRNAAMRAEICEISVWTDTIRGEAEALGE